MAESRLANPLPVRLGILGQVEDPLVTDSFTPAKRFERLMDLVQAACLHSHGFLFPRAAFVRPGAQELGPQAERHDIWTHFLWSDQIAATPARGRTRFLLQANAEIHARMRATAGMADCRTYVLHPPRKTDCSLDDFARQVGLIRDKATESAPTLGLVSPPSAVHHLSDPAELRDFSRSNDLAPVVHASNVTASGHLQLTQDDWTAMLEGVPQPGLFCWGAQAFVNGEWDGQAGYRGEATAEPRLLPFLRAIRARKCPDDSLLIYATRGELEILEAVNVVATDSGLDAHQLLAQRHAALAHGVFTRLA